MWNNGMTLRQRSSGVSARDCAIFCADAATLDCSNGTILGRDVVPDVCNINAISSCVGVPGLAGLACGPCNENSPARDLATKRMIIKPNFWAAAKAGPSYVS